MQGWRKSQEDAHIARTDLPDGVCLFGVFDGHGGKEVSIFVKEKFVQELIKLDEYKNRQYGDALKKCFRRMDTMMEEPEGRARLKQIQEEHGSPDPFSGGLARGEDESIAKFTGCTATVVLMSQTHMVCANAGDSRSVLGRASGPQMCFALSDDHKPDNPGEKARIEAAGGFVEENRVNGSLNLSRSIGDFEYKSSEELPFTQQQVTVDPEIRQIARQPADSFLVLACDGIWDCLTSEECIGQTRDSLARHPDGQPLTKITEEMFDRIIATDILSSAGVGTDNMTCIIVQLKQNAK
eukprot:CAMPEP_0185578072 /NCGR_PEP_ID=MMETSP0434-20130131/11928_1 /TAXON_ID=626734 ORGANISM="Favella taraikaensis, Strain Fe Narragansett Bay" /NCGR_SAMPLE_ID=MMETSP0434 /ASSEMBLY_ACC=CAM_ASM_000379 /LENGTH=295 /DNA_ID=CAMNT_0028195797 /DNA_START=170 /DNA_END=1057 /DNA_ORIENTATION=+